MQPDTVERRAMLNGRTVEEQRAYEESSGQNIRVMFDTEPSELAERLDTGQAAARIEAILRTQDDPLAVIRSVGQRMEDRPMLTRRERRKQAALARKGKRR